MLTNRSYPSSFDSFLQHCYNILAHNTTGTKTFGPRNETGLKVSRC